MWLSGRSESKRQLRLRHYFPATGNHVGNDVAVSQNHPLGRTRRTGGEHDLGDVVRRHFDTRRLGIVALQRVFQVFNVQVRQCFDFCILRRKLRDEGKLRLRLPKHRGDKFRRAANIERHCNRTEPQAAKERHYPFRTVRRPDDHPVALSYALTL